MKNILISVSCLFLTIFQAYWSMGEYANNISSVCLDCSFFTELIISGLISIIILFIIELVFDRMFWSKWISMFLIGFYLVFTWFKFINVNIFKTRVADWSTFSDEEINVEVLSKSTVPIIICISFYIIFYLIINKFLSNKLKK
jgi:hypothetical protein